LTEYFYGIGRPRRLISPGIITTGFNIALNLLLTPRFGIKAAAFISSCTYTLSFMLLAFRFSRASGVPVRALLLTSRDEIRQTLRAVFPAKPL
jgi:O-antigen/teichoic acid export membrane protein